MFSPITIDFNSWTNIILYAIYACTILTSIYVVLSENRNPIRSLAWVIALLFLPGIGLIFYLFFGRSLKGIRMISRHNKRKLMRRRIPQRINLDSIEIPDNQRQLIKLCHALCHTPITIHNNLQIFTNGEEKFRQLEHDLLQAKESILLQYYIFNDDELGHRIADILCRKAQEGVKVKVIYDHVGSFSTKNKFFKKMIKAGVEAHPFFRVTFPQLANRINWRNHRKVVVIDEKIGYIGGMNIADRYIKSVNGKSPWRDTHYRLTGEIVEQLYYSFMIDWNFKNPNTEFAPFTPKHENSIRNTHGMQFISSGPVNPYDSLALIFLKAIATAKKCVYIQTPYFLPTDALMNALIAAAQSKVDVRIMIPYKCDSGLLQYASHSYITQCLRSGIKIYMYEPAMLHSKTLIIDDDIVSVGSTNFDFRSFENNFECNMMIYSEEINRLIKDTYFKDLEHCRKITLQRWKHRPILNRALESIVRLFAPIL